MLRELKEVKQTAQILQYNTKLTLSWTSQEMEQLLNNLQCAPVFKSISPTIQKIVPKLKADEHFQNDSEGGMAGDNW